MTGDRVVRVAHRVLCGMQWTFGPFFSWVMKVVAK